MKSNDCPNFSVMRDWLTTPGFPFARRSWMLSLKRTPRGQTPQTMMKTTQIPIVTRGCAIDESISFPEPNECR